MATIRIQNIYFKDFINAAIRKCNFAMETNFGKGFAEALMHTSQQSLSQNCPHAAKLDVS